MFILFVARGYPTRKYKTHGIFELDQAKALAEAGHKVVYVALDVRSIRRWRKWGFERKSIDNVEIYGVNIPLGRVPEMLLEKVSIWGLKYLFKKIFDEQGKPDVIHAHFTSLGYITSIVKRQINIPLVITEHSSQINRSHIEDKLYKKASMAYKYADALIAVSPSFARRIEKHFNIKPTYIPNIVDTNLFRYTLPKRQKERHIFNFVSTGNLVYAKRMDLTIEAFYRAFYEDKGVTLTIFGEGPERLRLDELIKKYALERRVILKGMCSRKDIAKCFSYSDCFVLASQSETFGVAYIEALATGLPVIATKCGGPEVFVDDKNGVLVPVNNIDELTNAMRYMYSNISKYNRKEIAMNTKSLFSPEKVAKELVKVYKNVIGRKLREWKDV